MKRVLIWAEGRYIGELSMALERLHVLCDGIRLVGCASVDGAKPALPINGRVLPCVNPIPNIADYIVLTGNEYDYPTVLRRFTELGFEEKQLIADRTLAVPGFTFEKYAQLRALPPSILSMNCLGGLVCHLLCLPFNSPFVNLTLSEYDFIEALERDPRVSLHGELRYKGSFRCWQFDYPVCDLNGLAVNMVHYREFSAAKAAWYERLQRVNWYNLVVMMATESEEVLARFNALPFARKFCFTPLAADSPNVCHLPAEVLTDAAGSPAPLSSSVDRVFAHLCRTYDLWDMLLYGKKTPLEV